MNINQSNNNLSFSAFKVYRPTAEREVNGRAALDSILCPLERKGRIKVALKKGANKFYDVLLISATEKVKNPQKFEKGLKQRLRKGLFGIVGLTHKSN
ncbi:MAG: hypothetical protein A2104_09165 [Candidatus Melainabacteria bacterium GWF2_32_7]|nr:MAG: hypothetical protein A2104_09165 [Candidatus Melainabacteria bacterium GWF2_32_7]